MAASHPCYDSKHDAFYYNLYIFNNYNSFKLFDQNLSLTGGEPMHQTEMMALNIYDTFYGRVGYEGVGQAKAVIFFIIVVAIGMIQLYATKSKEVQQ